MSTVRNDEGSWMGDDGQGWTFLAGLAAVVLVFLLLGGSCQQAPASRSYPGDVPGGSEYDR